jgi:ParB family chromosome partitioning protein
LDLEFHQIDLRNDGLRVRRPEKERRLLGSLSEVGQQVPIVVVKDAVPGRYLVIDGFKRVRALRQLRQDVVRATLWDLSEAEALLLLHAQRADEAETAIEQAWLLRALHAGGMSAEDLAKRFSRSASWVSRRLGLVTELPESVQEQVRGGTISSHAAMKYLLPMVRAKSSDCELLGAAAAKEKLTTRQVGELYTAWRSAAPSLRRRIVEEPLLFLRARRELSQEPVSANPAKALLTDLDIVAALSRRVKRHWCEGAAFMDAPKQEEARRCVDNAIADLVRLRKQMEEDKTDAETRTTNVGPGTAHPGGEQTPDRPLAESLPRGGREGDPVTSDRRPTDRAGRESGSIPAGHRAVAQGLFGQSGPGP